MKKKLIYQTGVIALVCILFASINLFLYRYLTMRLGNNFSDASQLKMIEVGDYLPFEEESKLCHVQTDFRLTEDLPVLDGAAALVPVYASIIDNVYPEGCVKYDGGIFSDDNFYGENFSSDSVMQYKNTVRGFEALVNGETDLFFTAMPSDNQKAYATEKNVNLVYVPVGLEAFIFFVNAGNPIDNLDADEIRKMYSGEIKNWNKVGGANRPVNPVSRVEGSGSRTMMDYFMGDVSYGSKSPLAVVGGALGYSFRYYFEIMVNNDDVKLISVNGIYPDEENIKSGEYPVVTKFYMVYRSDNANPNVKLLVDWILSEEGQQLISECGYVPYL